MRFVPAYITLYFVYGAIFPYLPIFVRNLGYPAATVGILLSIAEGAGILGPFIFGRAADKYGKYKGFINLSYIIIAATIVPLVYFVHPVISAVLIALCAVGYRSIQPLIDAITTINLGEKGNYGKIRVFGSIAYVCFMFFLQWVPVMRPNTPINIAAWICISSVLAVVTITLLPPKYTTHASPSRNSSPSKKNADGKVPPKPQASQTIVRAVPLRQKSIWTVFFTIGLISIALNRLAMTPLQSFFPLFIVEYMHWDAVGFMMALSGIAEIPFIFFSRPIIRRFGTMPILVFTSIMVALRLGICAVFPFKAGVISAQLLHSFCFGLFHPASVAFISACAPPEQRSYGMALYLSLGWGLPALLGNFIGGFVVDYAGYRSLFGYFTVFALLSAAIYPAYCLLNRFTKNVQENKKNGV